MTHPATNYSFSEQKMESNVNTKETRRSLIEDSGQGASKLLQIHDRLAALADRMGGAAPTPISQPQAISGPPVEGNLRRNLDTAANWIDRISEQISRMENLI